jgi:hypothetical protein
VRAPVLTLTMLAALALAPGAVADGLPVVDVDVGASGVTNPGAAHRYVALPSGRNTVVARVERGSGEVRGFRTLPGRLTVPAVAYDGSAAGLSADGTTLTLLAPRSGFPRKTTTFALLDAGNLQERSRLRLRGDFSFDAMSPNGRWLYLIQYTSPDDPLQYRVRALDSLTGRLHPKPIVDPREPGEAMNGNPLTRATSPDGRWAYTLYDGTEHPFVHALDTANRSARCIDLDWLHGRQDLWGMRFVVSEDGRELQIRSGPETVAVVDAKTWQASSGVAGDESGWSPWWFVLAGLVLAAAGAVYRSRSRRRASSTSLGGATSA